MNKLPPDLTETACPQYRPWREFTCFQEFVDNLPYLAMTGLGAGVLFAGLGATFWGFGAGGLYILYSLAGAVWIMIFVCPHCQFYGTRLCPCGYGRIAARLRPRSSETRFAEQFRRHIPVIVPLWFIPLVAGGVLLARNFTPLMAVLMAVFVVDAFGILPLMARKYGCAHCPQKADCPWMKTGEG
jgi:hypothetical protein